MERKQYLLPEASDAEFLIEKTPRYAGKGPNLKPVKGWLNLISWFPDFQYRLNKFKALRQIVRKPRKPGKHSSLTLSLSLKNPPRAFSPTRPKYRRFTSRKL